MSGKCSLAECGAPDIPCHLGHEDYTKCPNFIAGTIEKASIRKKIINEETKSNLNWNGRAFTSEGLSLISSRTSPILIGIVGKADAGKTSFLAMLYTLLLSGRTFNEYEFAGTKTILGWDELHHRLRLKQGGIPFPPPTPVNSNLLYHFALRNKEGLLKDILFSDASGEVFSLWAVNRDDENAEIARWIYSNSNAFMLFIDYEALGKDKNSAKREILRIAKQMCHDLQGRPVLAVWSKSDKREEVLDIVKNSLKEELQNTFCNYSDIEISNFLLPGPDELVHKNNLAAIDWLLKQIMLPSYPDMTLSMTDSDDLFINYKGK